MARIIIPGIPHSAVVLQDKGITGTVNGVSTVFVCDYFIDNDDTGNSVLVAYVEDATTYNYSVTVAGVTYTGTINHSDLPSFVFDRTLSDVEYANRIKAKNRAETVEDLKGTLNASDMARVISNISYFCYLYGETKTVPSSVPEFPNSDNLFDLIIEDMNTLEDAGFVDNATEFYEAANPTFNQWYTWNDLEKALWENWNVITTRWVYFSGIQALPFIETDLDINEHHLFMYLMGEKYKTDISKACNYVKISAITSITRPATFSESLNELYAKIMEDIDTLMLETNEGYVLATNTGKVIVAKED